MSVFIKKYVISFSKQPMKLQIFVKYIHFAKSNLSNRGGNVIRAKLECILCDSILLLKCAGYLSILYF